MIERDLRCVISILKGEKTCDEPDWYSVLGFLFSHRIGGLFYSKAKNISTNMPLKVEKNLKDCFYKQKRKVEFMRREIKKITKKLNDLSVPYMLLKGSVLSNISEKDNLVYQDGERISNDIDLLVKPQGITSVSQVLFELGFVQGVYNSEKNSIDEFSRKEILTRRMNRGEVAPFVKKTHNREFPYVEVDINFSLGNTPSDWLSLLEEMVDTSEVYKGKVKMRVPNEELFFLHLIMHQYKEISAFFMVQRSKDLDLYKLADIYYLFNLKAIDLEVFHQIVDKYELQNNVGVILRQVGGIFHDKKMIDYALTFGGEIPTVIDYANKKTYQWGASLGRRLCSLDSIKFLKEMG